jgi:glycosyltransferase involved in cell wall biosynthesis
MNIAIYFEHYSYGGVDIVLMSLLKSWPEPSDRIVIFHNGGRNKSRLIKSELKNLNNLYFVETNSLFNLAKTKYPLIDLINKIIRYALRPILFIVMSVHLARVFKKHGPFDVLLSNNGGYPAAIGCLSAILAAKRAEIIVRILVVHHAATKDMIWLGWFDRILDHLISTAADAILSVSFATRKTLVERRWLYRDESLDLPVIHNGVDIDPINIETQKIALHDLIKVESTSILIGIMGRIEQYKGHEDLIHAFAKLKSSVVPRVHLVIIGSGVVGEVQKLNRICDFYGIKDRVHFLGYVAGSPREIIGGLDLLVSATRSYEGFGLTLAEAMSVGVPILATNVGAIKEFISDEVGKIISPSSPYEMAVAIDNFLEYKDIWMAKAIGAKAHIAQFNSKKMAGLYRDLFVQKMVTKKTF